MSLGSPFVQGSSNVYMKNKLLTALLAIIVLTSIYDSFQISKIRDTKETVILPYGDVDPYVIRHDNANMAYLSDMAQYIIFLYTNHSAVNVSQRYSTLLKLFHESSLPRYQKHLDNMSRDYSNYVNISHVGSVETHNGILVLENVMTINYQQSRITGQTVQPPTKKQLKIEYRIINSRFWIIEMSEKAIAKELEDQK